jgi:hypothetical protein
MKSYVHLLLYDQLSEMLDDPHMNHQNCHIKKSYPVRECKEGKLCEPVAFFDKIEQCKKCNKTL